MDATAALTAAGFPAHLITPASYQNGGVTTAHTALGPIRIAEDTFPDIDGIAYRILGEDDDWFGPEALHYVAAVITASHAIAADDPACEWNTAAYQGPRIPVTADSHPF